MNERQANWKALEYETRHLHSAYVRTGPQVASQFKL